MPLEIKIYLYRMYADNTFLIRRSMENTFIVGNYQPGVGATIILPKMELVKKVFSRRIS
jgi:hypothetical protein